MKELRVTPEQLHNWYLEIVERLPSNAYNPKAKIRFLDLTEEQKMIDRYIADKINALLPTTEDKDKQIAELQLEVNVLRKDWFNRQDLPTTEEIEKVIRDMQLQDRIFNIQDLAQAIFKLYTTNTQKGNKYCECEEPDIDPRDLEKAPFCLYCNKPLNQPEKEIEELSMAYDNDDGKIFNLYLSPIIDKLNEVIRKLNQE